MRIQKLTLNNFGPFADYEVPFLADTSACMLLTGKNNEGKSSILLALKLVGAALRSIGRSQLRIVIEDSAFYRLPQFEIEGINISRMLHNYEGTQARISATLDDGFRVDVIMDKSVDMIYADYSGRKIPYGVQSVLGFIPPLGPLAELEEILTEKHVRTNLNSTLAPRHLRNHFTQILSKAEYKMVQSIIKESWPPIQLLECERHLEDNTLRCFFKEGRIDRELAWAGQGLQIWFQIITHLVRLRYFDILVLDEPEVNLHPEKQNDLLRILREYHSGAIIVATHSVELMNNVSVSHILHVQKQERRPKLKATTDRTSLELVRSRIGSNFNLVASQFENCDLILYTEDVFDFSIISDLAQEFGLSLRMFNIPIHGFSEYRKATFYKDAYRLLIGQSTAHSMLLDRDYYPEAYLLNIRNDLQAGGIRTLFTLGKEIENIFLAPPVIEALIPQEFRGEFDVLWDKLFTEVRLDCHGSYITLHQQFIQPRADTKTVMKKYTPLFDERWTDQASRHVIVSGKQGLQRLREFYRVKLGRNLTQRDLVKVVAQTDNGTIRSFVEQICHVRKHREQTLHY